MFAHVTSTNYMEIGKISDLTKTDGDDGDDDDDGNETPHGEDMLTLSLYAFKLFQPAWGFTVFKLCAQCTEMI